MNEDTETLCELADKIELACTGYPTAHAYMAMSMVLGMHAAMAPRPDFDGFMELVRVSALHAFKNTRTQAVQ